MRRFAILVAVVLLAALWAWAANEGVIRGSPTVKTQTNDEATRSSAWWWDMKPLHGAVDTGRIEVSTYWGTTHKYICGGVYNNSATVVTVRLATVNNPTPGANDTVRLKIAPYSASAGKLPPVQTFFGLGATDSLFALVQIEL